MSFEFEFKTSTLIYLLCAVLLGVYALERSNRGVAYISVAFLGLAFLSILRKTEE